MASMIDADEEWDRQWHLAFNVRLSSADDLPHSAVRAMSAPLEDVVCFAAVMKGCMMALEAQQQPMSSELLLLKRLIHRNKSQHRNSMHLRSLVQLRVACERLAASGLTTIFKVASSVTHDDPAGGSMRGNTMPSRELVDLLISRLVAAAVLSHRALRAARLVFCANEELVRHTLFAPLAVTCMSLSARILHLATKLREALEESHLRFSALRGRAPVNPQSGADALPGAALMASMLQKAQSLETVPSDFDGQVACLLRLTGDNAYTSLVSASKCRDSAPHGTQGMHGSLAQPVKAAEMVALEVAAGHSGGGGVLRKAGGMSVKGAVASATAAEECGDAPEDEGVSVMMDLGIPLEEKQSTLPASKQGSKKSKGKAGNMAGEAAMAAGRCAAHVEPATMGAAATMKSLATAASTSSDGRVCTAAAADAGAAVLVSVKKKKKNSKLPVGKLGLGGSGAAALAALADCSRVRGVAPSRVPPYSSSSSASGAPPSAGTGRVSSTHGNSADDGGVASRGRKGAALMQLLMPAPAMADDEPGWSVKKPRDQSAASGGGVVQQKPKKRKLAELEGREGGGQKRRDPQDEDHTRRMDAPAKKAARKEGGRKEGIAAGGSEPTGAPGSRGSGGGASSTSSAHARGKVLGTKEKTVSTGIFADLFPKGGWGD